MPSVPWKQKSTSKRARISEKKGAKLEGGRRSPMSGGGRIKGDYQTDRWLVEDKTTKAQSFSITVNLIAKVMREAIAARRLWQFRITLAEDAPHPITVRLIHEGDYLALIERLDYLENLHGFSVPEEDPRMPFGFPTS